MDRAFRHAITYTNTGPSTVSDVAASLVANEQLIREAAEVLALLFPGLTVTEVRVNFREASTSSPLKELFAGAIVLAYQERLAVEVPALIERVTGKDVPEDMETLITVLVMIVAIYGISKAFELFGPKKDGAKPASPEITGNYNQVVHVAGDMIGVDPDAIAAALDSRYAGQKAGRSVAKKALEFIRPAKREPGAGVEGAGLSIDPASVAAAPNPAAAMEEEDPQQPYLNQEIHIHANDLDSKRTGWAGHLPGISDKRMPMWLYPTINTADLYGRRSAVADIIVMSRRNDDGELIPYGFHVIALK